MSTFFDRTFIDKDSLRKKRNDIYWHHAENLWNRILKAFPKTCESIRSCLVKTDRKEHPVEDNYDLIYGDVQSGKTRSIIILSWYCRYISVDIYPIILTINRGSVRDDMKGKMDEKGEISKIIRDYFSEIVSETDVVEYTRAFSLNFVDFLTYRKNGYIGTSDVLVLIQNASNFRELISLYKTQSNLLSMCVIVDEVHKMYTLSSNDRLGGLSKLTGGSIDMMYWLHNEAKNRIYLIGVSATPLRSMSDIHLYPVQTLKLNSDPVGKMVYYGQFWDTKSPGHIHPYSRTSEIDALDDIFVRRKSKYIRVVLITTKTNQSDHHTLENEILEEFPYAEVWVINDTEDLSLSQRFDKLLEDIKDVDFRERLVNGGIIIIGQKCFDAGVSVKPSPGKRIEFLLNGVKYRIFGITDQIYSPYTKNKPKNVETNLQAMRLFGYYPEDYVLNLWFIEENPKGQSLLFQQFTLNRELISGYKKSPHSILSYIDKTKADLFSHDLVPYDSDKMQVQRLSELPEYENLKIHETNRYKIGEFLIRNDLASVGLSPNTKLSDLKGKRGLQRVLRELVETEYKENFCLFGIDNFFQVPYSSDRYKELCKCVIHPKEGKKDQWKVKWMLTGEEMYETKIRDLILVKFESPILEDSKDDFVYYYQETDTKVVLVYPEKICFKAHKYVDNIGEQLSDVHFGLMKGMTYNKVEEEVSRQGKCCGITQKGLPCKRKGTYPSVRGMTCNQHK